MTHTVNQLWRAGTATDMVSVSMTASHECEDVAVGGTAQVSTGWLAKRKAGRLDDPRGWDRYEACIYRGRGKRRLVVVSVYAPFSQSRREVQDGATLKAQLTRLAHDALMEQRDRAKRKRTATTVQVQPQHNL